MHFCKGSSIFAYNFSNLHNMQIWTDTPTHPSICKNARRKYVHLRWQDEMFELSSLSLAYRNLYCIHSLQKGKSWRLKLTKIVLKQKFWEKLDFSRCMYYFPPSNLHSRHFSTHPNLHFVQIGKKRTQKWTIPKANSWQICTDLMNVGNFNTTAHTCSLKWKYNHMWFAHVMLEPKLDCYLVPICQMRKVYVIHAEGKRDAVDQVINIYQQFQTCWDIFTCLGF